MLNEPVPHNHMKFYLFVFLGMTVVILTALAFEHLGGYRPCKLCLQQREPWYLGVPVAGLAAISVFFKWPACLSRGLMAVAGIIMIYSLVLGIHHSGVEWGWWQGPGDCGAVEGGLATSTNDLLKQLEESVTPSCTEASLRVLGLSFAGWNAVTSLVLALVALRIAFKN